MESKPLSYRVFITWTLIGKCHIATNCEALQYGGNFPCTCDFASGSARLSSPWPAHMVSLLGLHRITATRPARPGGDQSDANSTSRPRHTVPQTPATLMPAAALSMLHSARPLHLLRRHVGNWSVPFSARRLNMLHVCTLSQPCPDPRNCLRKGSASPRTSRLFRLCTLPDSVLSHLRYDSISRLVGPRRLIPMP